MCVCSTFYVPSSSLSLTKLRLKQELISCIWSHRNATYQPPPVCGDIYRRTDIVGKEAAAVSKTSTIRSPTPALSVSKPGFRGWFLGRGWDDQGRIQTFVGLWLRISLWMYAEGSGVRYAGVRPAACCGLSSAPSHKFRIFRCRNGVFVVFCGAQSVQFALEPYFNIEP